MNPVPANTVGAIHVGDIRCYPMPDGDLLYPRTALYGDDPERSIGSPEQVVVPYTPLLIDTGSHRILIDTGAGPLAPTTGHLEASLSRAGFRTSDINVVMLSHAHPDHIGGLALEDGTVRFPNARILMSRKEHDFWYSADLRSRLGSGSLYGSPELETLMTTWIDRYLTPVRDRLEWVTGEAEIVPGIAAFDAPGHTPGHLGVAIFSRGESLLFGGDVLIMPEQVVNPDWTSIFDLDAQKLIETRRQLLDRVATDRSMVFHYHFGEAGWIRPCGMQFRWERLG